MLLFYDVAFQKDSLNTLSFTPTS